uniref:U6 snRNA-associated Sm-like protein LSm1 n=1 Tax=Parascaris univalens TaxID=6257 RepID=A0A914ZRQ4_PARUN
MASAVIRILQEGASARSVIISSYRTMYKNPYISRFKAKSKVTPGFYKQTTGLTGLFVCEHPHRALTVVYGRILRALEQMPVNAAYRKYTEQIIKRRLALVQEEPDIQRLEEKIGMGQIEEVIEQAEFELQATRAILESKAWEPLVEKAPENQWKWPIA